ncbi:MAG: hypothetical protein K8T25_11860 [Planctomycetia bacterium]|nr:hypothetical protein [Planctomycetia bacterium]
MAHFAELSEENVVVAVLVVSNDVLMVNGVEQEQLGVDLLESLLGHRRWKQTSYNGRRRRHYAGIGYQYREDTDMFVPPCPGEGWTLDDATGTWVEANP